MFCLKRWALLAAALSRLLTLFCLPCFLLTVCSLVQVYFSQTDAGGAVQDDAVSGGQSWFLVQAIALPLSVFAREFLYRGSKNSVTLINNNVRSRLWTWHSCFCVTVRYFGDFQRLLSLVFITPDFPLCSWPLASCLHLLSSASVFLSGSVKSGTTNCKSYTCFFGGKRCFFHL